MFTTIFGFLNSITIKLIYLTNILHIVGCCYWFLLWRYHLVSFTLENTLYSTSFRVVTCIFISTESFLILKQTKICLVNMSYHFYPYPFSDELYLLPREIHKAWLEDTFLKVVLEYRVRIHKWSGNN